MAARKTRSNAVFYELKQSTYFMKKGFTLVELLVVIAIIALLSTLSVVALNSARAKSRDARRLSDIRQIGQSAKCILIAI